MSKKNYHIIIKFTPNDNISAADQQKGWVDYFADFLKAGINYQLKNKVDITYKSELDLITKNDFDNANLIFYVLSPAMVFASNINQDSAELEQAYNFDIPLINSKIKKVFKAPVNIADLPLSLSTPTYYRFYDHGILNEEDYQTFEGWNKFQDNENYWKVFADVLLDTLKILGGQETLIKNTVFISDKNKSYYEARNTIKRELKAYETEIFPDEDFSIEANYMEDPELFYLKKCNMALHFPDEFIDLTNEEKRTAFNKLPSLRRLIWFNPAEGLKPEKKAKYNELKVQLKPYQNIEAVETTIEELKDIIKDNLHKINQSIELKEESLKKIIYIISDTRIEGASIKELNQDKSIEENFELKIIDFVENVTEYRHLHYELLRNADYFIILYFKNNLPWLNSMSSEIRKAPGFRNDKDILGKYIIYGQQAKIVRENFESFNLVEKEKPDQIMGIIKKL
ncbi:hypothetical protein MATR_15020 [Marivirga tractuosa]|uniref:TIR domain-containing protein n=1 Tax=Marivirga tractuosa (strain ATCC 23168 / DSM 4126 / NBRC 15989 / NCIMB 1408 / VKM B-1430 / H-43) TaxID=643867 RepID=E4TT24_MARTH|nr:hypothetical protein [Marivirga tractuosa]ADR20872.1 hypothetical protein Ftrac_0870 [Marivirga tractuosa DSM 4126]BDD14677.1 hypothetical protein MATR_15020 [Marivirga tractuosa]